MGSERLRVSRLLVLFLLMAVGGHLVAHHAAGDHGGSHSAGAAPHAGEVLDAASGLCVAAAVFLAVAGARGNMAQVRDFVSTSCGRKRLSTKVLEAGSQPATDI